MYLVCVVRCMYGLDTKWVYLVRLSAKPVPGEKFPVGNRGRRRRTCDHGFPITSSGSNAIRFQLVSLIHVRSLLVRDCVAYTEIAHFRPHIYRERDIPADLWKFQGQLVTAPGYAMLWVMPGNHLGLSGFSVRSALFGGEQCQPLWIRPAER